MREAAFPVREVRTVWILAQKLSRRTAGPTLFAIPHGMLQCEA